MIDILDLADPTFGDFAWIYSKSNFDARVVADGYQCVKLFDAEGFTGLFTTWKKPALFDLGSFSFDPANDVFNIVNELLNLIFVIWMYPAHKEGPFYYYCDDPACSETL